MRDLTLNYEDTIEMNDEEIFKMLDDKFKNLKLYNMSLGWRDSKEYILKCKGGRGDIIVGWE
jgi:hypothetical protein